MRESVKNLRNCNCSTVDNCPGYYIWWFRKDCVNDLFKNLPGVDCSQLTSDRNGYVALYVGIAVDEPLVERAKWHICQRHTLSNVTRGFLSTLRQTISALLGVDMTQSERAVNNFMDDNCELEWFSTKSGKEAEAKEAEELRTNYYPLNIRDNRVVGRDTLNALSELRDRYRK